MKKINIFIGLAFIITLVPMSPFAQESSQPLLTVKEIMNGIITPTTTTIWGAYQLQSEAEWLEVQNAALAVIGAGNLLLFSPSDFSYLAKTNKDHAQDYCRIYRRIHFAVCIDSIFLA